MLPTASTRIRSTEADSCGRANRAKGSRMRKALFSAAVALALSFAHGVTQSTVITFNGTAPEAGFAPFTGTYTEGDFTITMDAGQMFFMDNDAFEFPGVRSFDDDVLEFNNSNSQFTLTRNDGRLFDLVNVMTGCLGREFDDEGNFVFTGFRGDGSMISTTVPALIAPLATSFSGFTSLTRLVVTTTDGFFPVMDNLTLEAAAAIPQQGFPAPPAIANAFIRSNADLSALQPRTQGCIVSNIAQQQAHHLAYGPRGGPYDEAAVRAAVLSFASSCQ
jgi:hypothetical protein